MKTKLYGLFVACALGATSPAFAQLEDTGLPRPWNKKFSTCSHPLFTNYECPYDPSRNFPYTEEKLRGLGFYGQFEELEVKLKELSNSTEFFPDRRAKSDVVSRFLINIYEYHANSRGPSDLKQILTKWREAVPDSEFIRLIDARILYLEAWEARGGGYASSVSPEAWQLFARKLGQAEQKLLGSASWVKQTPVWNELLLRIAIEGHGVNTDWRRVFSDGVKRWPRHIRFYRPVALKQLPKWGGSWERLEVFIESATVNVQATEGRSFYARIYAEIAEDLEGASSVNWSKLQESFFDWMEKSPDELTKNRYASFACFARDKAAFKDAMAHIEPNRFFVTAWMTDYSRELCTLWAAM